MITQDMINSRVIIEAVEFVAKNHGIKVDYFCDKWVVKLTKGNQSHHIYTYTFDANSHATAKISSDKVASYQLLTHQNLPAVPHFLLTSELNHQVDTQEVNNLLNDYRELVIKPTHGQGASSVHKCSTLEEITSVIDENKSVSWCASPHISIESELRCVVYEGKLQFVYRKQASEAGENELKIFNSHFGATLEDVPTTTLPKEMADLAIQAAHAIGLRLGAVDIAVDARGSFQVLEFNSAFTLEYYAQTNSENRERAKDLYVKVILDQFAN